MTVLERLPFWIFFVLGALLIGVASVQYMTANGTLTDSDPFNAVPEFAAGDLVFFDQFDEEQHVAENGDVHLLGQLDPFWSTELDFGEAGTGTVYAFLPATQRKNADVVPAVVIARDPASFEAWMADNGAGNASIGDLFALHGSVGLSHARAVFGDFALYGRGTRARGTEPFGAHLTSERAADWWILLAAWVSAA